MYRKIIPFLFFISFSSMAQQKLAKEFSFVNDNDLFVSKEKDRYYTNGIFFTYRYLAKNNNEKLEKKIYEWQFTHLMFTPNKPIVTDIAEHDRPFASYLNASFGIHKVYTSQQIIKAELQVGVIGPAALGEGLQNFIHDLYGFDRPTGWKYQIRNAIGININGFYTKSLSIDKDHRNDINFISAVRLGTVFTDASAGFYGRIGFNKLQKISNSIAFNTSLNNQSTSSVRGIESMIYYKGYLSYVLYDATIQGSFLNTSSPVTFEVNPLRFDFELGLLFTANRINFGYAYHFYTDKQKNLLFSGGNSYGSIRFNYLFN
ncbi:MAG: lipid A deacylase LpxR family protein [Flavobacteriaceae bacterium]